MHLAGSPGQVDQLRIQRKRPWLRVGHDVVPVKTPDIQDWVGSWVIVPWCSWKSQCCLQFQWAREADQMPRNFPSLPMMSSTKSLSLTIAPKAPELEVCERGEGDLGDFPTLKLDIEVLRSRDHCSCAHQCHLSFPPWHQTFFTPYRHPILESMWCMCVLACSSQAHVLKALPLTCGTIVRGVGLVKWLRG